MDGTPRIGHQPNFHQKTSMNLKHVEQRLRVKEHELLSTLAGLEGAARAAGESEVRDSIDDATSSQGASESLEVASVLTRTLESVRDALHRLGEGTYGQCIACGRPIEPAHLKAIPWTPYCLDDQSKEEKKQPRNEHSDGLTRYQSA
jgi:DnaK suppressor protein